MGNMKANRKFIEGEEAVSAVIGVILMVAITVAIAATVYVYVSGMIGSPAAQAPNILFQISETTDKLIVQSVDGGVTWDEFGIRCDVICVWFAIDTLSTAATPGINTSITGAVDITDTNGIDASDYIHFGAWDGASPAPTIEDVTVTIVHVETNTVVGEYLFSTIAESA